MSAIRTLMTMKIVELRDGLLKADFQKPFEAPKSVTNPRTLRRHETRWLKSQESLFQRDGFQFLSDEELLDLYERVITRAARWR
jgi:hypothetical protein